MEPRSSAGIQSPSSLLPCGWLPPSHLTGSMGWGSGAGLLWYILMMLRISRLGSGRDAGPEGFTTGGSFFALGVCCFGFGSGGGKGGAGAIGSNSFKHQANKSTGETLLSLLNLTPFYSVADQVWPSPTLL